MSINGTTEPVTPVGNGAQAAPEDRTTEPRDLFLKRQERIDEQRHESLEHKDPLTSIIGTEMVDLMSLQLQVGEALREAIGTGRVDPQDLSRNREGIEMMLKLAKQVAQYTQLHRKLIENAEPPHPTKNNQSEEIAN